MIFGPELQNYVRKFLAIAIWHSMVQKHQKVCFWIILWFTEAVTGVTEHLTDRMVECLEGERNWLQIKLVNRPGIDC